MSTVLETPTPPEEEAPLSGQSETKVLVILEGKNDINFLTRISRILHADEPAVVDLGQMESDGQLILLPVGGSDHRVWSERLAPLGLAEFHLLDRDAPPVSDERRAAIESVNHRNGCIAALTGYRNVENYLHPQAIYKARRIEIEFSSDDDLSELIAQKCYHMCGGQQAWDDLPSRKRRQMKHRVRQWLNTEAVSNMTPQLLDEQDPGGDVRSWLEAIEWLAGEWE